jgi:hypothetical protein
MQSNQFQTLSYGQVETASGRENMLQSRPAIYAWYRTLRFGDSVGSQQGFLSKIRALLSARLSESFEGQLGLLYQLSVHERAGRLSSRKEALLDRIAASDDARKRLAEILERITFLQAPLYVGKTRNLRQRISDHVDGTSELLQRLERAGIALSSCILKFVYLTAKDVEVLASAGGGHDPKAIDEVTLLVEELLTRLAPSAFVRRPG